MGPEISGENAGLREALLTPRFARNADAAPHLCHLLDRAACGRLYRTRLGRIHPQGSRWAPGMIVREVASQEALQMPLMQDDHLLQTLPPATLDEPCNIRMRPW